MSPQLPRVASAKPADYVRTFASARNCPRLSCTYYGQVCANSGTSATYKLWQELLLRTRLPRVEQQPMDSGTAVAHAPARGRALTACHFLRARLNCICSKTIATVYEAS